jgi:hypothetical protein
MYLTHPNHQTRKLSRTGHTSWTLTAVEFTNGPYLDTNTSTTTISTSAHTVGAGVTMTASASTFVATDVGRQVRFRDGYGIITAFTSVTVVTIEILIDMGSSSSSADWSSWMHFLQQQVFLLAYHSLNKD